SCCFDDDSVTATFYTLSLHDALPISSILRAMLIEPEAQDDGMTKGSTAPQVGETLQENAAARKNISDPKDIIWKLETNIDDCSRSEEHTSELQSRFDLVCRLLLEKTK